MRDDTQVENFPLAKTIIALTVWWLWMPVGAAIIWLVKHFVFGTYGQQDQSYVLFLQADFFPHGSPIHPAPLFWVWATIGMLGTVVIIGMANADASGNGPFRRAMRIVTILTVLSLGASVYFAWSGFWDADKQAARYYAGNTVFSVTGIAPPPSSLRALTADARPRPCRGLM